MSIIIQKLIGSSWVTHSLVMSITFATFAVGSIHPLEGACGQATFINIQSYIYYG